MVAHMNAVAVCPEGKEFLEVPSGRMRCALYLTPFTIAAMKATEKASADSILPQSLRLSTLQAFIINIAAAGEY